MNTKTTLEKEALDVALMGVRLIKKVFKDADPQQCTLRNLSAATKAAIIVYHAITEENQDRLQTAGTELMGMVNRVNDKGRPVYKEPLDG